VRAKRAISPSICLFVLIAGSIFYLTSGRSRGSIAVPNQQPIINATQAIDRASRLTALGTLTNTKKISALESVVQNDRTPFLWKQLDGRPCWKVDFADVSLRLKSSIPSFRDNYLRKFSVLLDRDTGQLISVFSQYDYKDKDKDPDLRPQPSGEAAESQLSGQEEIYHGLPPREPRHTFLEALDIVLSKGIGSPFVAKEIYGSYVLESRSGGPQYSVWVITLNGLPPIPVDGPHGDSVPVWQRNHMRNVIDDETGVNLFATNSPQP
jgi:hypothetical protein